MNFKYEYQRFRRALRESQPAKPRGTFPSIEWAWPTGGRDLLIRAAALSDTEAALSAFREWRSAHAQAQARLPEQRLLLAISQRLPAQALSKREAIWLAAIEHKLGSLCTRAQLAAKPALAAIAGAGIDLMVFKGAARSAIAGTHHHVRFAREIDLLVRPRYFARAVRSVLALGWKSRGGAVKSLERTEGMNLVGGELGEIDLHKHAYHQVTLVDAHPTELWRRARQCTFLGQTVFVPSPTDQLMMALAHGAIGGHGHSDWLVDCAVLIHAGEIDWPLVETQIRSRDLEAGCLIALRYLAGPLAVPVPEDVLNRLEATARAHPLRRAAALLEARPRREHSVISALGRGTARVVRMMRTSAALKRVELASAS